MPIRSAWPPLQRFLASYADRGPWKSITALAGDMDSANRQTAKPSRYASIIISGGMEYTHPSGLGKARTAWITISCRALK